MTGFTISVPSPIAPLPEGLEGFYNATHLSTRWPDRQISDAETAHESLLAGFARADHVQRFQGRITTCRSARV